MIGYVISAVLIVFIAGYAAWVIYRQVKLYKAGKFCDCGCADCSNKTGTCENYMTKDEGHWQ